ncbi:ESPR domain-containing protein [Variovorax sp. WS11]|uniref:ESPR domain-containing protein n=1 Tax=Variovorax sp. WS11 TaxID=1105204 RepID=UPI001EF2B2C6|nr:ESPR domain-containing protein [Variovorax sp. WS11]
MNKHLHRVVFNAVRGLRVVVQETARSAGKATGTTPAIAAGALFGVLVALPGQARSWARRAWRLACGPRCWWRPTACP